MAITIQKQYLKNFWDNNASVIIRMPSALPSDYNGEDYLFTQTRREKKNMNINFENTNRYTTFDFSNLEHRETFFQTN